MKYSIDYRHIFFDRYDMTDDEKKNTALDIVNKSFGEKGCRFVIKDGIIDIDCDDIYSKIGADEIMIMLRKEFFILFAEKDENDEKKEEISVTEKAERYIKANYLYEALTANEICEAVGMSRKIVDNMFIKKTGKTLSEYIKYIRVEKAKELIGRGENMEDVAALCGFGSVKTMQRSFKSVEGKTPGCYKGNFADL